MTSLLPPPSFGEKTLLPELILKRKKKKKRKAVSASFEVFAFIYKNTSPLMIVLRFGGARLSPAPPSLKKKKHTHTRNDTKRKAI